MGDVGDTQAQVEGISDGILGRTVKGPNFHVEYMSFNSSCESCASSLRII